MAKKPRKEVPNGYYIQTGDFHQDVAGLLNNVLYWQIKHRHNKETWDVVVDNMEHGRGCDLEALDNLRKLNRSSLTCCEGMKTFLTVALNLVETRMKKHKEECR